MLYRQNNPENYIFWWRLANESGGFKPEEPGVTTMDLRKGTRMCESTHLKMNDTMPMERLVEK